MADVLFGDVNPSGRLPLTFPNVENERQFTVEQYPGTPVERAGISQGLESYYTEKLLVGYKQVQHTHGPQHSSPPLY